MKVIAHRGYSARHAENTLSAYLAAIAAGADMIESDARLSSDGVVFALHDADLARIAKNPITVAATGSERLRAVRLEGGERLATLSSVLSECGRLCPVLVDVKRSDAAIIRAILDTIKRIGHRHEVWIGVRDIEQCKLLSTAAPSIPVLAFLQNYEDAPAFERAGAQAHRVWEGDLGAPTVPTLFGRRPIWVTSGGRNTGREVGDTDAAGLAAIVASGASAVLLNDPSLATAFPREARARARM